MDRYQTDTLNMQLKTKVFFINNADALQNFQALQGLITELSDGIQATLDADEEASEDITGYAAQKQQKEDELIAQALKVSAAAASKFVINNDQISRKKVDYTQTELEGLR